jgi:hypothetical protein
MKIFKKIMTHCGTAVGLLALGAIVFFLGYFLFSAIDMFDPGVKVTKTWKTTLDNFGYIQISKSEAPVTLKLVNVDDFNLQTKIGDKTTSYPAISSGDVYQIEIECQPGAEYSSPPETKMILSSPQPFVVKVFYGFSVFVILITFFIFFAIFLCLFFSRLRFLITKKD